MKKDKSKNQPASQYDIKKYIPAIKLNKIPPDKVLEILRTAGYNVNEEQSEEIMEFLYIIVKLTLKEFFTSD